MDYYQKYHQRWMDTPRTVMKTRAPALLIKVIFVVYKSGGKLYLKNLINFLPIPKSKLKCGIS